MYNNFSKRNTTLNLAVALEVAKKGGVVFWGLFSHVFMLNKNEIINNVGAHRPQNNLWNPSYNLPSTTKFYILYFNPK